MEVHNLEKNILYRLCEEMTGGNHCGPVAASEIYRSFADLPAGQVTTCIQSLADGGCLRYEKDQLYLTSHGLSEIRTFIPPSLLPTCNPKSDCF
jgi:hypothetical protein